MVLDKIKVADAVWIALATLHRTHPERTSFTSAELTKEVHRLGLRAKPTAIAAHIHSHTVANRKPDGGRYRMLMRVEDNSRRLYRPGDQVHNERRGKTVPKRGEIPPEFHHLLDWYEREYCQKTRLNEGDDPIEAMWGLGREIWADTDADSYVASLRLGWRAE